MKFADVIKTDHLLALLPVLLGLWVLVSPQMLPADVADYNQAPPLLTALFSSSLLYFPLLLVQGWLSRCLQPADGSAMSGQGTAALGLIWFAAFLLYPACWWYWSQTSTLAFRFEAKDWQLVAILSLLYWCHQAYQRRQRSGPLTGWSRLWSLDAVLLFLLTIWTLAWATLLTSHPPGFAVQPIHCVLTGRGSLQNRFVALVSVSICHAGKHDVWLLLADAVSANPPSTGAARATALYAAEFAVAAADLCTTELAVIAATNESRRGGACCTGRQSKSL